MPNQSIITISPSTYSEYAAVILGYFKMGYSPIEIQNTLGSVPEEISIILRSMDSTHFSPQEGEQLWNKSLNILLPEGLYKIQHLAGLHLVAEAYHENMQSIKSINRLTMVLEKMISKLTSLSTTWLKFLNHQSTLVSDSPTKNGKPSSTLKTQWSLLLKQQSINNSIKS